MTSEMLDSRSTDVPFLKHQYRTPLGITYDVMQACIEAGLGGIAISRISQSKPVSQCSHVQLQETHRHRHDGNQQNQEKAHFHHHRKRDKILPGTSKISRHDERDKHQVLTSGDRQCFKPRFGKTWLFNITFQFFKTFPPRNQFFVNYKYHHL